MVVAIQGRHFFYCSYCIFLAISSLTSFFTGVLWPTNDRSHISILPCQLPHNAPVKVARIHYPTSPSLVERPLEHSALLHRNWRFQVQSALSHLIKAHRHERSFYVKGTLYSTFLKTQHLWKKLLNFTVQEKILEQQYDVCPERWLGNKFGYPFYVDGYETLNCEINSTEKSLGNLLSIVLDATASLKNVQNVLLSMLRYGLQFPVFVLIDNDKKDSLLNFVQSYCSPNLTVTVVTVNYKRSWSHALAHVSTKYVLVGRHLTYIDTHANFHRLIRMIDYLNFDFVAGSHRDITGRWNLGSYLTAMKNYEYKIVEGYDLAYNSCAICDYVSGPFMAKTETLKDLFDDRFVGSTIFVNLFEKAKRKGLTKLVCADSMFYTQDLEKAQDISHDEWKYFTEQWEVSQITVAHNKPMQFACRGPMASCKSSSGMSTPPCCLQTLASMLNQLMVVCKENSLDCEIVEGPLIGAIKFNEILPWELDGAINVRAAHREAFMRLRTVFQKQNFYLEEVANVSQCWNRTKNAKTVNCGYFALWSTNRKYRVEIWGSTRLAHDWSTFMQHNVTTYTRLRLDGQWVNVYPNPALYARNLNGDDVFEHIKHWMRLGYTSGWIPYRMGAGQKCAQPKHHACLDNFVTTGSLQFAEIVA